MELHVLNSYRSRSLSVVKILKFVSDIFSIKCKLWDIRGIIELLMAS